jgi:WS/DGAT/MGAT family acyltransferase
MVPTPLGVANPVWADDPDFDIARHVNAVTTNGPVSEVELRDAVGNAMGARLDRARPPWQLDVVEELEGGGMALMWRIHHCMADGSTCVRVCSEVLWSAEPCECGPASEWSPAPTPGWRDLLMRGVAERLDDGAERSQRDGIELRKSRRVIKREFGRRASHTPFDHRAGSARSVAYALASLEECKRAGKCVDEAVTLNDVILALVAGGVREWLQRHGGAAGGIRAKVPVSLHRAHEDDGVSNRDSYFFVDLPVDEPDPANRLRAINRDTTQRKLEHDAETLYRLGRHPMFAHWAMSPYVFTFNVSNVRGPASDVYVLGAKVREMYSFAEIAQHHALRVAVFSAGGHLSFGLCADRDAVPDVELLAGGVRRSTEELLALAR